MVIGVLYCGWSPYAKPVLILSYAVSASQAHVQYLAPSRETFRTYTWPPSREEIERLEADMVATTSSGCHLLHHIARQANRLDTYETFESKYIAQAVEGAVTRMDVRIS